MLDVNRMANDVADLIKGMQNVQGVSINALSKSTGIPFSTLRRRLTAPGGRNDFTLGEIARIAQAFGVEPADLIPGGTR